MGVATKLLVGVLEVSSWGLRQFHVEDYLCLTRN